MYFSIVKSRLHVKHNDTLYLIYEHYDDYGYCTTYNAYVRSRTDGNVISLGAVKIGCSSLHGRATKRTSLHGYDSYSVDDVLPRYFEELSEEFFSLGQDVEYYKGINKYFGASNTQLYTKMRDLAYDYERFNELYAERNSCLINSLMRSIHYANVEQFHRITLGEAELTKYSFHFNYDEEVIDFKVDPDKYPPSNIHVLIGRNGVGKTFLLYNMVCRVLEAMDLEIDNESSDKYKLTNRFVLDASRTRFAGVIGMSFSVFDDGLSSIRINSELSNDELQKKRIKDDIDKKYKYIGLIKYEKYLDKKL